MKVKGIDFEFLDKPLEFRDGKTLIPQTEKAKSIVPINQEVYIVISKPEEKPKSTLVLPDTIKEKDKIESGMYEEGAEFVVVATGKDCKFVQPGDVILPSEALTMSAPVVEIKSVGLTLVVTREPYISGIFF